MIIDNKTFARVETPAYIIEEDKLRKNLKLISSVAKEAQCEIILAFKAFALWKTFPILREYINSTTASSLSELRMGRDKFGAPCHTYSPAYTEHEIDEIAKGSSHLTFNSMSQYERFHERVMKVNPEIKMGIRVNPEHSEIETDLYNPCAPGSRFGVLAEQLPDQLPEDITGFHCHCHCESSAETLERNLVYIEEKFGKWFPQIEWLNLGGGHLMTRKDYNTEHLINIIKGMHVRYPWLRIILEPGSAFAWQTGVLVAEVVDIVENHGIKTAILNVSFTCHMPDCLEMPYWPDVRGAQYLSKESRVESQESRVYRLGGNSCLSGDFMGDWEFDHELRVGEKLIFEDMVHYTTVKTNMFNGISHPSLAMLHSDGELEILREYTSKDYIERMD